MMTDQIMETANKRRVQNSKEKNIEMEDLPQHLIHHIMDFLPTKDATKLSVLSKSFNSSCLSFPVIDFDHSNWFPKEANPGKFFSLIHRTLQLRRPHLMGCLHKVRFTYKLKTINYKNSCLENVVYELMKFAAENKAKEIDFDVSTILPLPNSYFERFDLFVDLSCYPIQEIFCSKHITVLKLQGFRVPVPDLVLTCSSLKVLRIHNFDEIRTLRVSCRTLKEVEFGFCNGLKGIRVETENLESFKFIGQWSDHVVRPCEIDLSACQSLKILSLEYAKVSDEVLNLFAEFLYFRCCLMPKNVRIQNSNVRILDLKNCYEPENLVLCAENLRSFEYRCSSEQRCEIDVSACNGLTNLVLEGATITDRWIRKTISALSFLKTLNISRCNSLEKIEFSNEKLQTLILKNCTKLKEAEIYAPNLLQFSYTGKLDVSPIVLSAKCRASIVLKDRVSDQLFETIRMFLCSFDHYAELTLVCNSGEDLTFPSEFLSTKLSPLHDVKHLTLELRDLPNGRNLIPLVESLLWLVPNPQTLTFSSGGVKNTLKFEYPDRVHRKVELEDKCCIKVPIKCWRHYAIKIGIEGFEAINREILEKFFAPYVEKNSEYFCCL